MLKFKYLCDNRDLLLLLLSYWDYDSDNPDAIGWFRISANAVYMFMRNRQRCYLRFTPLEEKEPQIIQAKLDFLRYIMDTVRCWDDYIYLVKIIIQK